MAENKKPSIFSKVLEWGTTQIDAQIAKARLEIEETALDNVEKARKINKEKSEDEEDFYGKAITEEPNYQIASQGYKEKPHRLQDAYLKQMSLKNSVVAAVIQTRQNQVASHSTLVKSKHLKGYRIVLKDEESKLAEIKEKLKAEYDKKKAKQKPEPEEEAPSIMAPPRTDLFAGMQKAEIDDEAAPDTTNPDIKGNRVEDKDGNTDDEVEVYNFEIDRKAKEKLEEDIKKRRKVVEEFVTHCGYMENRPFETKKWNFDAYLRATVRDSLTYDRICTEIVPTNANKIHDFFPVDASTIKFSTVDLKKYKNFPTATQNLDYAYSEKQLEFLVKEKDVLNLDEQKLEQEKYKYVQVIRGKIERAYTEEEMIVGQRNHTTDIYNNGYAVSELELMMGLVTSHLNTEYYNTAFFTQGFSAKGILHIKAPINRRKLETIRQQFYHLIKGNRNSFSTPIFAGVDAVNWIPLNQNHSEMEFQVWMQYLVKMICAIYQMDPSEIGFSSKETNSGSGGGGLGGSDTATRIDYSKEKGLKPFLTFLATYLNDNIIDKLDPDFKLEFVGIDDESEKDTLARQEKEVKLFKTVNEIREENNRPPLPGMDDLILDSVYFQWYAQFSSKADEKAEKTQKQQMQQQQMMAGGQGGAPQDFEENPNPDEAFKSVLTDENPDSKDIELVRKSLKTPIKVEFYKFGS